ncbi:lachrymatory-factor synthase-like [Miscanthus floridulus]|uniref:lachrymatory-factor synthase-like n=1 Tax=Miscanthus floridulus TaxID=154761 RepID=UPI003457EF61
MEKEPAAAQERWQGTVEATLPSTPASAAWPHIASFCALHRYLPSIDVCELAEGEDGRPGCVRYVASLAPGTTTGEVGIWAREKLLEIDHDARRLAYAVVGSSMGLGSYVATMSIVVGDQEEEAKEPGCRLVWAFECEPVQGWTRDGLLGYLDGGVKAIAARMEEAHAASAVVVAA